MRFSKRQVRKLRRYIAQNRCPVRPGLTHDWLDVDYGFTEMSANVECLKCHEIH